MSSSGLVLPSGDSVRAPQLTGRSWNAPLETALTVPVPVAGRPAQVASARRTAVMVVPPGRVARGTRRRAGDGRGSAGRRPGSLRRTGDGRRGPRRTGRRSPGPRAGRSQSPTIDPRTRRVAGLAVDPRLDPADQPVAEQDRQDVVAPASLLLRDVDLPDVVEAVERAQEVAVPDVRVERGEEGDAGIDAARPPDPPVRVSAGRRRRGGRPWPGSRPSRRLAGARPRRRRGSAARRSATKRSPRIPSTVTGVSSPASSSSARSCGRVGPSAVRPPAGLSTGAVPYHSSAEPLRPRRPWAR